MSLDPTFPQKRLRVSTLLFEAQVDSNHPRRCTGPGTSLPAEAPSSAWQLKLFAPFVLLLLIVFVGCGAQSSGNVSNSQSSTVSGAFTVSPGSLSFGNVTEGTTHSLSESIKNTGTNSLTLSAVTVSGAGYHVSGLKLPVTLKAGQSTTFTVSFAPSATGTSNGSVHVTASTGTATVAVTGAGVAASTHSVDLSWAASTSSNIVGYHVYRSAYSGSCGSFGRLNSSPTGTTVYTDRTVANGASYCYAVTAVSTTGTESSYSNIVSNLKIPAS